MTGLARSSVALELKESVFVFALIVKLWGQGVSTPSEATPRPVKNFLHFVLPWTELGTILKGRINTC